MQCVGRDRWRPSDKPSQPELLCNAYVPHPVHSVSLLKHAADENKGMAQYMTTSQPSAAACISRPLMHLRCCCRCCCHSYATPENVALRTVLGTHVKPDYDPAYKN